MGYRKTKEVLAMANLLINTRPDASSAEVMRKAASMLRDIAEERAHITQPAQAVDVTFDMVREAEHFCPTDLPHLDKLRWKARRLTELLAAALPNANGKEG